MSIVHTLDDRLLVERTDRGPDHACTPKVLAFFTLLELLEFV